MSPPATAIELIWNRSSKIVVSMTIEENPLKIRIPQFVPVSFFQTPRTLSHHSPRTPPARSEIPLHKIKKKRKVN